jgi:hypothetical protein
MRDHTDLDAWKLCNELRERVQEITARPTFRDVKLKEQLDEAVDSPCPNVGEGFSLATKSACWADELAAH